MYLKLVRINDTPQKIAFGFGLGAFVGILPGAGPFAALLLALVFRANRISALLGSILTNTWLSVLTFFLSIKIGSAIMNLNWQEVRSSWIQFLTNFNFLGLFKLSIVNVILPVVIGYFIISFCAGIVVYFIALAILSRFKKYKRPSKRSKG